MRQLPISHSDFAHIRREGYYYIDKSRLICDLIDSAGVCLITRPRRFGKTLNLSMLRYFYGNDADYRACFEGLAILDAGERYLSKLGQHPVIYLSLKEVREKSWAGALVRFRAEITRMCEAHLYLRGWEGLTLAEAQDLERLWTKQADEALMSDSLKILSIAIARYHGQKAVILIDEYDAPIEGASKTTFTWKRGCSPASCGWPKSRFFRG
jgi:hypothetical protein